jgi:hypothetical protein
MRLQLARTQGELEAARAQLAGLIAAEEQWRVELEAAKEDAVSSQTSLVHLQNQYQDRLQLKNGHIARLEYEMAEADRRRRQAEREREAVIAVLGRRARKHLEQGTPQPVEGRYASEPWCLRARRRPGPCLVVLMQTGCSWQEFSTATVVSVGGDYRHGTGHEGREGRSQITGSRTGGYSHRSTVSPPPGGP